jgi:hypothetical protein
MSTATNVPAKRERHGRSDVALIGLGIVDIF